MSIYDGEEEEDLKKNKEAANNYNKMYHLVEKDWEITLKQRKLEESDRQVDSDVLDADRMTSTAAFGAANLSLKHLLATIETKRDDLSLTDLELRNLISDVRKNRSKWASEDKIGQEELYEAAEKVVLELRGYTEHSTAFLNKVNKRDAPNYFNVIKTPMDLNLVMKKLKTFQYKSKRDFVSDLMLIWRNCLTYNTDPKHFLRAHALAMQKKTLSLIPLIPDITVRDRAEVEADEAAANPGNDSDDESQSRTSSRKGVTGSGKHTSKGRKRKINEEDDGDNDNSTKDKQLQRDQDVKEELQQQNNNETISSVDGTFSPLPKTDPISGTPISQSTPQPEGRNLEEELNEQANSDKESEADLESQVWHELYSKRRSVYCTKRGDIFKDDKLRPDAATPLRRPLNMGRFKSTIDQLYRQGIDDFRQERLFHRGILESLDNDRQPFLLEYEIAAGVPTIPWALTEEANEEQDLDLLPSLSKLTEPSGYVCNGGLSEKMSNNLHEIQQIRKICSKISLIRQMQQQSYMHANQIESYKQLEISEEDLDSESRLPNRDPYYGPTSTAALKRAISKIAMHDGFEVTESGAIEALTEIAGDYLTKLGRTLVLLLKQSYDNDKSCSEKLKENILLTALEEHGINGVAALDGYIRDGIERHGAKLQDLKRKLTSFMGDLLRPSLNEITDTQFQDDSEAFLNGDFGQEIGDDFFGFRELGLDKELGLLTSSVPFHLLHNRLSAANNTQDSMQVVQNQFLSEIPDYPPMDSNLVQFQIGLLKSFFIAKLELSNSDVLLEGDQLPPKQRNSRPKVPPTGKISGPKKKQLSKSFVLPDEEIMKKDKAKHVIDETVNGMTADKSDNLDQYFNDDSIDSLF